LETNLLIVAIVHVLIIGKLVPNEMILM